MKWVINLIFKSTSTTRSLMILFGRLSFGIALLSHGLTKVQAFDTLKDSFPDPIGWGSAISVSLVIFAEMFCSFAVILGFLQRLAIIPIIISMCIAFFITYNGCFVEGELALTYLFAFTMLLIGGPGRFSIDHWLYTRILSRIP